MSKSVSGVLAVLALDELVDFGEVGESSLVLFLGGIGLSVLGDVLDISLLVLVNGSSEESALTGRGFSVVGGSEETGNSEGCSDELLHDNNNYKDPDPLN